MRKVAMLVGDEMYFYRQLVAQVKIARIARIVKVDEIQRHSKGPNPMAIWRK